MHIHHSYSRATHLKIAVSLPINSAPKLYSSSRVQVGNAILSQLG
jgi:hypothetical protein